MVDGSRVARKPEHHFYFKDNEVLIPFFTFLISEN